MVTFDWNNDDCQNLVDFIELYFFEHLHDLYDISELDNFDYLKSFVGYLKSFVKMHDDLESEIKKRKRRG